MTILAYCRVSTGGQGQSLEAQVADVRKAGATRIFQEKISGARSDRPELAKLMKAIGKGDTLIICKIDRLARSTRELLNLIAAIDQAGATLKSLGDPLFNTSHAQGRLLVAILGAIAEFERELTRERTSAGRERAKARGVRFGRPRVLNAYQQAEAIRRKAEGEPLSLIARTFNCSSKTIARLS
jgi:DNA invertase Pin-like site-specific DNA recombinase